MRYIDENYIKSKFKMRTADAHKGNFGKVLIFAGSVGMAGAAILCGKAALQSGAGLVQFLLPDPSDPIYPILQTAVPEATCVFYKEGMDFSSYTSVAAGSGLGKSAERLAILKDIITRYGNTSDAACSKSECATVPANKGADLKYVTQKAADSLFPNLAHEKKVCIDAVTNLKSAKSYSKTLVLDADALNLISEDESLKDAVVNSSAQVIITPHIGEAKRLLHTCEGIQGFEPRMLAVSTLAEQYNCIAILKGVGTLVCQKNDWAAFSNSLNEIQTSQSFNKNFPAEAEMFSHNSLAYDNNSENENTAYERKELFTIFQNTTGNPGMATAGSGDTLTGIIASLAGQGYTPFEAACLGVYFHGKAGDLAAKNISQMGLTAGDIAHYVPYSFKLN